MLNLNENWLTEQPIDFEYKSYLLLAYQQKVDQCFTNYELYPIFTDLLKRLNFSKDFIKQKKKFNNSKKLLKGIEGNKIITESGIQDLTIEILEEIVLFALPIYKKKYIEGEQIYENIYKSIKVFSLALHHSSPLEGIMIIDINKVLVVYKYTIFKHFLKNDDWIVNFNVLSTEVSSAKKISEIIKEHKFNIYLAKYELNYIEELHKETFMSILKKKFTNRIVNNL